MESLLQNTVLLQIDKGYGKFKKLLGFFMKFKYYLLLLYKMFTRRNRDT